MKGKDVSTLREFHDDGIFEAIRAVILGEFGAEASGLDANHGVELRIEIGGATEDLGGNLEFLDGSARMIDGVLGQVAKQFTQRFRAMQGVAADEPINLLEKLLSFGHTGP